jgi:hypothetical protein
MQCGDSGNAHLMTNIGQAEIELRKRKRDVRDVDLFLFDDILDQLARISG